jgi:hypothetical protein
MAAIFAALQMKHPQLCSKTHAASACSRKFQCTGWADCVEKLDVFDPLMFVTTLISFGGS